MSNFDGRAIAIRRFLLYWLVTDSIKAGVNGNRQTVYSAEQTSGVLAKCNV